LTFELHIFEFIMPAPDKTEACIKDFEKSKEEQISFRFEVNSSKLGKKERNQFI
jgi:hypothetical protein